MSWWQLLCEAMIPVKFALYGVLLLIGAFIGVLMIWRLPDAMWNLRKTIMLPKLVRMGRMLPTTAYKNKPWLWDKLICVLTGGSLLYKAYLPLDEAATEGWYVYFSSSWNPIWLLVWHVFATLALVVLPLFRVLVFPWVWPVAPFLAGVCYMTWWWRGVDELLLCLVLFMALPTTKELLRHYFPRAGACFGFLTTVAIVVLLAPILVAGVAQTLRLKLMNWFVEEHFTPVVDWFVEERFTPSVAPYWRIADWYQSVLGFPAGNITRVLSEYQLMGLSTSATKQQIKQRYRVLARKTHPDETGKDDSKFIKLRETADHLTRRFAFSSETAPFIVHRDNQPIYKRLQETSNRCVYPLMPIIVIWLVWRAWAFYVRLASGKVKRQVEAAAAARCEQVEAAAAARRGQVEAAAAATRAERSIILGQYLGYLKSSPSFAQAFPEHPINRSEGSLGADSGEEQEPATQISDVYNIEPLSYSNPMYGLLEGEDGQRETSTTTNSGQLSMRDKLMENDAGNIAAPFLVPSSSSDDLEWPDWIHIDTDLSVYDDGPEFSEGSGKDEDEDEFEHDVSSERGSGEDEDEDYNSGDDDSVFEQVDYSSDGDVDSGEARLHRLVDCRAQALELTEKRNNWTYLRGGAKKRMFRAPSSNTDGEVLP